jgi:hypothetical protein
VCSHFLPNKAETTYVVGVGSGQRAERGGGDRKFYKPGSYFIAQTRLSELTPSDAELMRLCRSLLPLEETFDFTIFLLSSPSFLFSSSLYSFHFVFLLSQLVM